MPDTTASAAPFRSVVAVRWSDFDQYGHANNTAFLEYAQQARVDFFVRGLKASSAQDFPASVVRRLTVDYQRTLLPDTHEVFVDTEITAFGRTSYTLRQTVRDEHEHITAVLDIVMVMFDLATATPVEVPSEARRELQRYVTPELEAAGGGAGGAGASGTE